MATKAAPYVCYVFGCYEPVDHITTPMIGPCRDHTDAEVLAERDRIEASLAQLRARASRR